MVAFLISTLVVVMGCSRDGGQAPMVSAEIPCHESETASLIDETGLLEAVTRVAHDEMEGRFPGSQGDRLARSYLADRLADLGYEPGFSDGSWQQPVAIVGVTSQLPELWSFGLEKRDHRLHFRGRVHGRRRTSPARVGFR